MLIELHLLQNFAPSNLNRDDTNSPKDCEFGGHRRARISSQCIKRSIRRHFRNAELLPREDLAYRTNRLLKALTDLLNESGHEADSAPVAIRAAFEGAGFTIKENGQTEYLFFLGHRELESIANQIQKNSQQLLEWAEKYTASKKPEKKSEQKKWEDERKKQFPSDIKKTFTESLDGGRAADLGLFGRMLANLPEKNIDASSQVAHALSTNKISMEMDFYTAVDDLKEPDEDAGAGMLGTVEFNSACFYRYANIDFNQLQKNLQNDTELAKKTVGAFLNAAIHAIPTGKQNSFAAHNCPSLVLAVVRKRGLYSLANAFEKPIYPDRRQNGSGLVAKSIEALDRFWERLNKVYGADGLVTAAVCKIDEQPELSALKPHEVGSVAEVINKVISTLRNGKEAS